jgi:HD-GYP domain-containing protein (c-di-GMP phosphodiesterase class II)
LCPPPEIEKNKYPDLLLRFKEAQQRLAGLHQAVVCALNQLLDLKDLNTGAHSTRLAEWAVRVAQELAVDDKWLHDIEIAALLHDLGKIGVPDSVLNKPGRLTGDEEALVRRHPEYGWAILRQIPGFERASLYILHHHEAIDGSGYPGGLRGSDIPLGSRIVAVVDAFDAMVASRSYRAGLPLNEALRRLRAASGTQFDPQVVEYFTAIAEAELADVVAASGLSLAFTAV